MKITITLENATEKQVKELRASEIDNLHGVEIMIAQPLYSILYFVQIKLDTKAMKPAVYRRTLEQLNEIIR